MNDETHDVAGVIAPPPLIFGGAIGLGLLLQAVRPLPLLPPSIGRPLGGALAAGSVALGGSAFAAMRRAGTNVEPYEPTTAIVPDGPYRFSRNPIYLSFALLTAGIALLANARWVLLLLPAAVAAVQRGVVEREERYLARRFGDDYGRYRASVRRWL